MGVCTVCVGRLAHPLSLSLSNNICCYVIIMCDPNILFDDACFF